MIRQNYQKMIKNRFIKNILIIVSFLILSFISAFLLLKSNNVYEGFDTQFHFKRIMEIVESMKNGQLLPNFSFNEFHGSAVMTLYPYFNLLPAVFLSFIIKSKVILVYAFFISNTFITFIISFFSVKNCTKLYSTSYIFSIIYSLSNIFLVYNFTITDFGISSSYTFLPLIVFGFLKLLQGKKSWIELSLGMNLLLSSHILNIFIIGGFLLIILLINIRYLNKQIMINLFKSIILFLITSSVIWLPILNLYIHNLGNISMPFSNQLFNINIKEFMSGLYGSKTCYSMGTFSIIGMFLSIFFYKKFDRWTKQIYWISLMIVMAVLFLPWHFITSFRIFNFLTHIQSTYRFLIIPQMIFSFIFSLIISKYIISINKRILFYVVVIFISIILQVIVGQYSFVNKGSNALPIDDYIKKYNNNIFISNQPLYKFNNSSQFYKLMNSYQNTNDDYIPKNSISKSFYVNKDLGFYNNQYKIKVNNSGYNTFRFVKKNNLNKISLPLYAYNKQELNIYLNNHPVHYYANKNGLLTINNIKNYVKSNNKVYVKEVPNKFKVIGIILSISGWLFVLILFIKNKFIKILDFIINPNT